MPRKPLKDLTYKEFAVINLKLDGLNNYEIAEKIDRSEGYVRLVLKREDVKELIRKKLKAAHRAQGLKSTDLLDTLCEIMITGTDKNKIAAINTMLKFKQLADDVDGRQEGITINIEGVKLDD